MAKLSRATLKTLFGAGSSPTEDHFADLIESSVNVLDDAGIDDNKLVHIHASEENQNRVMQLYQGEQSDGPTPSDWDIQLDNTLDFDIATLLFRAGDKQQFAPGQQGEQDPSALALTNNQKSNKVGINTNAPQYELDVNGVVKSSGRIGVMPDIDAAELAKICADGQWHPISLATDQVQGFEVVAKISGEFNPMVHAIALFVPEDQTPPPKRWWRSSGPKKPAALDQSGINITHSGPGKKAVLQLRWFTDEGKVSLQIRSVTALADNPPIVCYVSRLWLQAQEKEIEAE